MVWSELKTRFYLRLRNSCFVAIFLLVVVVSPVFAEGAWVGNWDVLADQDSATGLPTDLAVDSNRTVYVVDLGFNLVMKKELAAPGWTFLLGQPYNEISHWLVGVAVDPSNNVYVLNGYSGSTDVIWKYNGSTWANITNSTSFIQPTAVAVDTSNNVYVADRKSNGDTGSNRIRKLASGSTIWTEVGSWANGGFTNITAISAANDGYLYAIEALSLSGTMFGRLVRLASGTTTWEAYPSNPGQFSLLQQPNDLAVDRFGNVYVTDHVTQKLHVFPKNESQWGQIKRDGDLRFNDIYSVAVDNNGFVYVSDPAVNPSDPARRIYRHHPWATQLIWETQPTGTQAYSTLNPNPVLKLAGPAGDTITTVSPDLLSVSLTIPAGANLNGTIAVAMVNGRSTYTDLYVDKAGMYTLTGVANIISVNIKQAAADFPAVDLSKTSNSFVITAPPKAASPTAAPPSGATLVDYSYITLSSSTVGAHFHYTTDGSTPTGDSPSGNTVLITGKPGNLGTIKAFTSANGFSDSDVVTFTYTVQYRLTMPIVYR